MWFKKKKEVEIEPISSVASVTEFTLLDPRAVSRDIHTLINIAVKNAYLAVCINPINVSEARNYIDNVLKVEKPPLIVSTVGFPIGASTIQTKVTEAKQAISDGADELDVMINVAKVKEGDYSYIKNELSRIVRISKGRVVKAIIETCYLNRDEIKLVSRACEKAKVDFIKTSSGYGTAGATTDDVSLIFETVRGKCSVKASGGIRSKEQAEELIRAGASRIGTSRIL